MQLKKPCVCARVRFVYDCGCSSHGRSAARCFIYLASQVKKKHAKPSLKPNYVLCYTRTHTHTHFFAYGGTI